MYNLEVTKGQYCPGGYEKRTIIQIKFISFYLHLYLSNHEHGGQR